LCGGGVWPGGWGGSMVDADVKVRPDALCDVILRLSHGIRYGEWDDT